MSGRMISEESCLAAMRAVERETIDRCAEIARNYAKARGGTGESVPARKARDAGFSIARMIETLPLKSAHAEKGKMSNG